MGFGLPSVQRSLLIFLLEIKVRKNQGKLAHASYLAGHVLASINTLVATGVVMATRSYVTKLYLHPKTQGNTIRTPIMLSGEHSVKVTPKAHALPHTLRPLI